jgi:FdhD/NarQ family
VYVGCSAVTRGGAIIRPDCPGASRAGSGDCALACDVAGVAMLPARMFCGPLLDHLGTHGRTAWSILSEILTILRRSFGNALDKLAGALARDAISAEGGFVVFTSRGSVEMIQKAAAIGVPIVVAISAPTALAVRMAEGAGITLIAVARNDGFEVFTHSERILNQAAVHVA